MGRRMHKFQYSKVSPAVSPSSYIEGRKRRILVDIRSMLIPVHVWQKGRKWARFLHPELAGRVRVNLGGQGGDGITLAWNK